MYIYIFIYLYIYIYIGEASAKPFSTGILPNTVMTVHPHCPFPFLFFADGRERSTKSGIGSEWEEGAKASAAENTWTARYIGGGTICIIRQRQNACLQKNFKDRKREGTTPQLAAARQCGRPTRRMYIHMEAGLCRRPYCVYMGSPTMREAR